MDKAWVWLPRNSLEYEAGATKFVVESARSLGNPSEMFCPCLLCRNVCHQSMETVVDHLVIKGMDEKYKRSKCWSLHGDIRNDKTTNVDSENEAYELFRTAFMATEGTQPPQQHNVDEVEDIDNQEDSEFRKKLKDAETPLYSTCLNYTKVSAIMGLYRIKVKSGMSENYFDQLLMLLHDMLPGDNVLPKSTDDIKKFLKLFGFGYDVIHACKNDCILYRNQYEKLVSCPRCSESRWEKDKHTGEEKKGIPAKVLRYFPIKDRFRRMFRSKRLAEGLRWHFTNASDDGSMRHPVDSLTWANVNNKWPEFSADPRNLRLGLSTDGMNPFSIQNTKYSTWPVFLVNYNMAPTECMKAENIMLTLLIPGPTAPSNNIDVYLQPLIDDLKELWTEGMEVYDSFTKESFNLRAILLWTITDYPALGTLAGCKVKGKQACNVCGKDTPHRWLKFSRKHVYMGNRKRLRPGHPYRRKKHWFDNTVEAGTANRIQSGAEIYESLKDFRNDFGRPLDKKGKRRKRDADDEDVISAEEYEEDNVLWRWKKRSILFDLPYWKDMPVRHNIDVMHVEKNVSDALLSILMHSVKSKDGLKARKDLEDIGIRTNLHTEVRGKRTYLPPAAYWLSKEEKRKFCKRLSKFRGPDGYCANISNCVSVDPPKIGRNAAAVLVNSVSVIGASVWRPTQSIVSLSEAVGVKIPWPSDKIILDDANFTQPPNSVRSEASDGSIGRVHIFDYWNVDSTDLIAEGILLSVDPKEMVNNAPLGPNAAVLNVDKVVKLDAYLWRPTRHGSSLMGDALNEIIAWPADRIQIPIDESTKKSSPQSGTHSTGTSKGVKQKCFLLDNSGEKVAVGRVCSTNPEDTVHCAPLGPNASKIWVEVSMVDGAPLWRPTSEFQVIADAVGNWVAWSNNQIVFM